MSFDTWSNGRDLTASTGANEIWNIACYGDAVDTTAVTVTGWDTSESDYIRIYTPTSTSEVGISQRHSGVWNDSAYRMRLTAGGGSFLNINTSHVIIEGLQISKIEAPTGCTALFLSSAPYVTFDSCIAKGSGFSSFSATIFP